MPKFASIPAAKTAGPGRYSVGENLYLDVAKGGTASWMFLYRFHGKQREMSLGSADIIKLSDAKGLRAEQLVVLKVKKQDPIEVRRAARALTPVQTVQELIGEVIAVRKAGWTDPEGGAQRQWAIANAHLAELLPLRADEVTFGRVLDTLLPQWSKQRAFLAQDLLEDALTLAVNKDQITKNVARWRGGLDSIMPKKVAKSESRDAMDPALVPALVARLAADAEVEAQILLAIVLTGMREAAVSGMRRDEIVDGVWTIPADRMKRKKSQEQRPFAVPLSTQMLALIAAQPEHESGLVFPSKTGKLMSNTQLNNKMRSLGLKTEAENNDIHGFRSSMSTWGNDATAHEERVIDAALGHVTTKQKDDQPKLSKVAKVYNRADYFEKRVPLMQDWADHCYGVGNVKMLPARKAA